MLDKVLFTQEGIRFVRIRRILVAKMWVFCQICKGLKDFDGNNRALGEIMLHFCYGICAIDLIVENKRA